MKKLALVLFLISLLSLFSGCGGEIDNQLTCTPCSSGNSASDCAYHTCMNYLFSSTVLSKGSQGQSSGSGDVDEVSGSSGVGAGMKTAITSARLYKEGSIKIESIDSLGGFHALFSPDYMFVSESAKCWDSNKSEWKDSSSCLYGSFSEIVIAPVSASSASERDFNLYLTAQIRKSFDKNMSSGSTSESRPFRRVEEKISGTPAKQFNEAEKVETNTYIALDDAAQNLILVPIEEAQSACRSFSSNLAQWTILQAFANNQKKGVAKSTYDPNLAGGGAVCPSDPPGNVDFAGGGSMASQALGNLADVRDVTGGSDAEMKKAKPEEKGKSENAASAGGTLARGGKGGDSGRAPSSAAGGAPGAGNIQFGNPETTGGDSGKNGFGGALSLAEDAATAGSKGTPELAVKSGEGSFEATAGGSGSKKSPSGGFNFGFGKSDSSGVVSGSVTDAKYGATGPDGYVYTGNIDEYLLKNGKLSLFEIVNVRMDKWGSAIEGELRSQEFKKLSN